MPKQTYLSKSDPEKNNRTKTKPGVNGQPVNVLAGLLLSAKGGEEQFDRLGDVHFLVAQRQALATEIGRVQGNQYLQQLLTAHPSKSEGGIVQRSPVSDELEKLAKGKSPDEIFALVGQQKFKDEAKKGSAEFADLEGVIGRVLTEANDVWVAKKILAGKLGMSTKIVKAKSGPSKDIPPQPIEVHFFPGASEERALVIAGVHGSERQGTEVARMLIDDVLAKAQPHYTVIVVPSLFPGNAHQNWGVEGRRQAPGTETNRNFPDLTEEIAEYKGGQALDAAGDPLKDKKDRDILAENVMLMELIDRFQPSRIISIHGTWDSSAAGIFADPHFLSPAKEKAIEALSGLFSTLWGIFAPLFGDDTKDDKTRFEEVKTFLTETVQQVDEARTQNDIDLALATAYAVADKTASAGELKGRFSNKKKQTTPSVAGNKLYKGTGKENATWREDMIKGTNKPKPWQKRAETKGISLGLYGPAKGMSVFTVEPPINRALDFYDGKKKEPQGAVVSKAQRETELKAYAEAVATILLGPDEGAEALRKQRPAPATTTTPTATPATGVVQPQADTEPNPAPTPSASAPLLDESPDSEAYQAALKAALKVNRKVELQPKQLDRGGLVPIRAFLKCRLTGDKQELNKELVLKLAAWQREQGLTANGQLDTPTLKQLKDIRYGSKDWSQRDATEQEAIRAAKERAEQLKSDPNSSIRAAIVSLAESQIGQVNNLDRGDGKKYGWERLREYYDTVMPGYTSNKDDLARLQKAGNPKQIGAWSWCGIFALWAVTSITGKGSWKRYPAGLSHVSKKEDPKLQGAKPGDILHIKAKNHHFLLAEPVMGETLVTIDGAQAYEGINKRTSHTVASIQGYYRAVEDGPLQQQAAVTTSGQDKADDNGQTE